MFVSNSSIKLGKRKKIRKVGRMRKTEEGNVCPCSQVAQNLYGRTEHMFKISLRMFANTFSK